MVNLPCFAPTKTVGGVERSVRVRSSSIISVLSYVFASFDPFVGLELFLSFF